MTDVLRYLGDRKQLLIALAASFLLAAYAPMTSIAGAQAAADTQKLKQMKEKAQQELDRRIGGLEETLKKLKLDIHLDNENLQANAEGKNGSVSATANKEGLNFDLGMPSGLKDKVKEWIEKFIEKLKGMKEKVTDSAQLGDMLSLGKSIDSQAGLDQLTNIQGAVTKSIESLTSVFDKLTTVKDDIQGQVTKLKACVSGIKTDGGSVDANADKDGASVKASASGCGGVDFNTGDIVESAQSQLDNVSTIMSTIGSVLTSAIAIITTLVSSFSGITGGLGNLGSLGDISNLGSLGGLGGLLSSFTALTSQLDIANGMSTDASGLLGSLSNITSAFSF